MKKILFLFGELNDDDIDWIISMGCVEKIPFNTILVTQGAPLDIFYILLDGQMSISITIPGTDGNSKEIALLSRGEVFGELSLMDTHAPSATVQAVEDSLVLSIPQQKLITRLETDVGFSSRFYRAIALFLSSRLRNTMKYLGYEQHYMSYEPIEEDDIPPEVVPNLPMAQARFDWLLRRVKNEVT